MRVEISIAKEKAGKMPKGSLEALKDEMNRVFVFGKVIGSMPQTYRKHG